jgi:hypothetical protein
MREVGGDGEARDGEGVRVGCRSAAGDAAIGTETKLAASPAPGVEGRTRSAADALAELVRQWDAAHASRAEASRQAALARRRAERRLARACGGLSLERWRSLVDGRSAIRVAADGRDLQRALGNRSAVLGALAELEAVEAASAVGLAEAEATLAGVAAALLPYGPLASAVTGWPLAKLCRLTAAHRPRAGDRGCPDALSGASSDIAGMQRRGHARRPGEISLPGEIAVSRATAPAAVREREVTMAKRVGDESRTSVRECQRRLAELAGAYERARARRDAAIARRASVVAAQDRLVEEAEGGVRDALADLAGGVGVELAASLTGLASAEVRRLVKANGSVAPGRSGTVGGPRPCADGHTPG